MRPGANPLGPAVCKFASDARACTGKSNVAFTCTLASLLTRFVVANYTYGSFTAGCLPVLDLIEPDGALVNRVMPFPIPLREVCL